MYLLLIALISICLAQTTQVPDPGYNDETIPFIIGLSLMGFIIIVLAAALLLCFCINHNRARKNYDAKDDNIALKSVKSRNCSALLSSKVAPLTNFEEIPPVGNPNVPEIGKFSMQLPKPKRFRRASVPAVLSTLPEASPSLEASRKMSLSHNCVMEPARQSQIISNAISDETLPENGPFSLKSSKEQTSVDKPKRYSIYDDATLSNEEFYSKYGKIMFSVQYNIDLKTLEVIVLKAQHLTGQRIKGKNRFYVKIRLTKQDITQYASTTSLSGIPSKEMMKPIQNTKGTFRTSIKSDFCNPKFDESFKFTNVTSAILDECILQFIIKEETPKFLEKNRVIGQVNFQLNDAQLIEKHELITEILRDIQPSHQTDSKGYVKISMNFNRPLGKLCICIMEIISGTMPLVDVCIEICLRTINDIVASKKEHIAEDLKSNRVFEISLDNCLLNSCCLVVLIFARIRNSSKTPYGRVVLGPIRFTDGPGLVHWAEMSIGDRMVIKTHEIL